METPLSVGLFLQFWSTVGPIIFLGFMIFSSGFLLAAFSFIAKESKDRLDPETNAIV